MSTAIPRSRTRVAGLLAALALVLPAGCSDDDSGAPAAAEVVAPVARDLMSYDAFVLGSAVDDPANADVYAIRFDPFAIDRITVDKRISYLGADETHLVVAAADENIDQLARVTGNGALEPIPGLGRPFAYSPRVFDGVLYYEDAQGDEKEGENRSFAWDLEKRTKKLLIQSTEEFGGTTPIGGGRFVYGKPSMDGQDAIVIRSKTGKLTTFQAGGDVSDGAVGRDLIALTLVGANDRFGDKPEALVLLDLDTGEKKRVPGLQVIAWNPAGTRLLARRTDAATDSKLVLLDPAKPDAAVDLQTVPGLAIYGGVWVRGDAPV